ncbi:MAG TPA: hypothetical protein DIS75_01990 [Chryseobacterium sp.]|nr:hypothetical protein [Chryseobacterium sp.]
MKYSPALATRFFFGGGEAAAEKKLKHTARSGLKRLNSSSLKALCNKTIPLSFFKNSEQPFIGERKIKYS